MAIDYETPKPPPKPSTWGEVLNGRMSQSVTIRGVVALLGALIALIVFFAVMLTLFPQGG